jgi:hypothetical protein
VNLTSRCRRRRARNALVSVAGVIIVVDEERDLQLLHLPPSPLPLAGVPFPLPPHRVCRVRGG